MVEWLEPRRVLSGVGLEDYSRVSSPWFAQLAGTDADIANFVGPIAPDSPPRWNHDTADMDRWIVRLTSPITQQAAAPGDAARVLDDGTGLSIRVVRGLGLPGQLLIETPRSARNQTTVALSANSSVASFELDGFFEAAATPNDPEFVSGRMTGLDNTGMFGATVDADIHATEAWDASTGSTAAVVGLIDSGVDATHPDLYLNIWINQGEIRNSLRESLSDIDDDGRITFYDLNNCVGGDPQQCNFSTGPNALLVRDRNGTGFIDALDVLNDPLWSDGRDTDKNGFIDDFFGWNFRTTDEPFAPNNPSDTLGHGTHVAGTIAAVGNNGLGVAGINWRSSIMSLKFLDENNRGRTSDAVLAVNYATMMSRDYGVDIPVLNSSWGQPGTFSGALESAIRAAGDEQIVFVAAAGNGNILGDPVDNDTTPFYPASFDLANVIAVAASDSNDELAGFSNFGRESVDIAAPGVGILSTLPGGRYGSINGTSMAAPHVSGTIALVRSIIPQSTVAETRDAMLGTVDQTTELQRRVAFGGRLNAAAALDATVFAPSATLLSVSEVTPGATIHEITVRYDDRSGIDAATVGDGDLLVARQWGPRDQIVATLKPDSITPVGEGSVTATYQMTPPGGSWDPLDFGEYRISTVGGEIASAANDLAIRSADIGSFMVRIDDPSYLYVDSATDTPGTGSLRDAVIAANAAAPEPRTIILAAGTYRHRIPRADDPTSMFPFPSPTSGCTSVPHATFWSGEASGDLDITGSITIIGDHADLTSIDAGALDRVFKVYPGASLTLRSLSITGGVSRPDEGGGGILSAGDLNLHSVIVRGNRAVGNAEAIGGGGIASWGGQLLLDQSRVANNLSGGGGGVFLCNGTTATIQQSTIDSNLATVFGGGVGTVAAGEVLVKNSTFSGNVGGAINHATRQNLLGRFSGDSEHPSISSDGRYIAFHSNSDNIVSGDFDGALDSDTDVFVYDRVADVYEKVSRASDGTQVVGFHGFPAISADGRFVAFESASSELVEGDTNRQIDIFVVDRQTGQVERVNVSTDGTEADNLSGSTVGSLAGGQAAISGDGRFVAFGSAASNLVSNDINFLPDIFVYDRVLDTLERVSENAGDDGAPTFGSSSPSLSGDGRFVAFVTDAALVAEDTNFADDVYVLDRELDVVERVSVANDGSEGTHFFNTAGSGTSISEDGRFVAFSSFSDNLVPDDTNFAKDIFVYDRELDTIERVSVSSDGTEGNDFSGHSVLQASPVISGDGRYVVFSSNASNLVEGDTNGQVDVFRHDRLTGATERISQSNRGETGSGPSQSPTLGGDGQVVAFSSRAGDLTGRDTDGTTDVFAVDLSAGTEIANISDFSPDGDTISVEHATFAFNSGRHILSGPSDLRFSLLTLHRSVEVDDTVHSDGGNIFSAANPRMHPTDTVFHELGGTLESLQLVAGIAPVHLPVLGNPAIDGGDASAETIDQLGRIRNIPDIGAVEVTDAKIVGAVFVDQNMDGAPQDSEPRLPGVVIFVDRNGNALRDPGEPSATTNGSDNEYRLASLVDSNPVLRVEVPDGFAASQFPIARVSVSDDEAEGLSPFDSDLIGTTSVSVSGDGRFVAFASGFNNLTPDATDQSFNVFVRDTVLGSTERVVLNTDGVDVDLPTDSPSISDDGRLVALVVLRHDFQTITTTRDVYIHDRQLNTSRIIAEDAFAPAISGDGSTVAFISASDRLAGDSNNRRDVYVYDVQSDSTEIASLTTGGEQGEFHSGVTFSGIGGPALSFDGRFVAFSSAATLHSDDTNDLWDIFVRDRELDTTSIISFNHQFISGAIGSFVPDISDDGNVIAFSSDIVIDGDSNGTFDVFTFDRAVELLDRVSIAPGGDDGNKISDFPTISGDGRYVAFESLADNLVSEDNNGVRDIFVVDRANGALSKATTSIGSIPGLGTVGSEVAAFSGDGSVVAFISDMANLVSDDFNRLQDAFTAANPFQQSYPIQELSPGEIRSIDIGVIANPGTISGTAFLDRNVDGILQSPTGGTRPDETDLLLPNLQVYIDQNQNLRRDFDEPIAVTDSEGRYEFENVVSHREHQVRAELPSDLQQFLPGISTQFAHHFFLPAAGSAIDRNFALIPATTTGQSDNSAISGHLFQDLNRDGIRQADEPGVVGASLFLDLNEDGLHQPNEPITVTTADVVATRDTDESGFYAFTTLGGRTYVVRLLPVDDTEQTSPIGVAFATQSRSFKQNQSENVRDVATADINQDGYDDLVVALRLQNGISVLLNDTNGGFANEPVNVFFENGIFGAAAVIPGDFNGSGTLDLAVANNESDHVTVLLDFNGAGFDSRTGVVVQTGPVDITSADVDSDSDLDLLVTNQAGHSVSILLNDGAGSFHVGTHLAGFNRPRGLVAGQFNDDNTVDIAVTNTGSNDITVLLNDGSGNFDQRQVYNIGFAPYLATSADFNGDGNADLAVVSFVASSISLWLGGDGMFSQPAAPDNLLSAGVSPTDIQAVDIDSDGDVDLLITDQSGDSQGVAILRNRLRQTGFGFEPPEAFGVGRVPVSTHLALSAGDLDRNGTVDVVIANSVEDSVNVLFNTAVAGTHRVELDGVGSVAGLNFGLVSRNDAPTFDPVEDLLAVQEDAGEQTIALTGISAGPGEDQLLRFTATTNHPQLLTNLSVDPVPPGAAMTLLRFTPTANQSGTAVVTLELVDAGFDNEFDRADDNAFSTRSFTVNVNPLNDPPTLAPIASRAVIDEGTGEQSIQLSGVTAGGGESQPLQISATVDPAGLITSPIIDYTSPQETGTLRFASLADAHGTAVVTVTVIDGGLDQQLATTGDNSSTTQAFYVTVGNELPTLDAIASPQAIDEDSGERELVLTGLSAGGEVQPLVVTAISSNTVLIPHPTVSSVSENGTAILRYQPADDSSGMAVISVTVTDGGFDADLDTPADNASFSRTFTIDVAAVNDPPEADHVARSTNEDDLLRISLPARDVDGDALTVLLLNAAELTGTAFLNGNTLTYDPTAALVFQQLSSGQFMVESFGYEVRDPDGLSTTASVTITVNGDNDWHNNDAPLDVSRDGVVSPLDVVLIVNTLNAAGPRTLAGLPGRAPRLYDTNNDNRVSPVDVLQVVNFLNEPLRFGEAEGNVWSPTTIQDAVAFRSCGNGVHPMPSRPESRNEDIATDPASEQHSPRVLQRASQADDMRPITWLSDDDWDDLLESFAYVKGLHPPV